MIRRNGGLVCEPPLWQEVLGALPRRGVPCDGPDVDEDAGARWDMVAEQLGVLDRLPRGTSCAGVCRRNVSLSTGLRWRILPR
jgi:hypothetical protein